MPERTFDGRKRVVIEKITPAVDNGRFPIKRIVGEKVEIEADVFVDGHDILRCGIQFRHQNEKDWREVAMTTLYNDRWNGAFIVTEIGIYLYTVVAWVDDFESWRRDLAKRTNIEDIALALQTGAMLIRAGEERAVAARHNNDAQQLRLWSETLLDDKSIEERRSFALSDELAQLVAAYPDRTLASRHEKEFTVVVDDKQALFSSWYELFPRSVNTPPLRHGTLKECIPRLAEIAAMGFDIVYLPPIHPIGHTNRKGRNNSLITEPGDPGSPWAIGDKAGGHKSVHPELGSLDDFRELVENANNLGLRVALDIAFQCSPDHPYVREHSQWFHWRPDGTVQYAENPPKKYQDIYPLNFETDDWKALWEELKNVFEFWIERGVRVFRVDNPHTKPFPFWEWLIREIKHQYPDVIFLSEAFTRPKVMYRLAKLGFTQSYTYFTWRNTKWEITHYLNELTRGEVREYLRPNFWPNTPDILHAYLQFGGKPAFVSRLVLAATLSSNYGIYGPAFELMEAQPREPGSEEYLDSEKYEIRLWDTDRPDSLSQLITRINQVRRENPALQQYRNLQFFPVDNDQIICYAKWSKDYTDIIITFVNLDPYHTQSGWVELPLDELAIDPHHPYQMHDLLNDERYLWNGANNYIELNPQISQAHIFKLLRHVRTEHDFEYYL
ncbi:MAG TPA: alpha-1,4-glucan--maltose-1-phosphate maltosyltransferase [Gammaproteobacteria bacterium]